MESDKVALKRELKEKNNQLNGGLENVAIQIRNRRKSFEENLKELKDFKEKTCKAATKSNHQLGASELVVGNLFEIDT
jgi:lipoate synthase